MMTHDEMVKSIQFLRPNAEFVLRGSDLEWLDTKQTQPTQEEIEAGVQAYKAKLEADKIAKEARKKEILDRLGLTEEEAKLILK